MEFVLLVIGYCWQRITSQLSQSKPGDLFHRFVVG